MKAMIIGLIFENELQIIKSIEINVMAIPARADKRAALGVILRTHSATNDPKNSINPERKQATNPTFHANL